MHVRFCLITSAFSSSHVRHVAAAWNSPGDLCFNTAEIPASLPPKGPSLKPLETLQTKMNGYYKINTCFQLPNLGFELAHMEPVWRDTRSSRWVTFSIFIAALNCVITADIGCESKHCSGVNGADWVVSRNNIVTAWKHKLELCYSQNKCF